jgi:hypothetical protein
MATLAPKIARVINRLRAQLKFNNQMKRGHSRCHSPGRIQQQLTSLRESIVDKPPYISGTLQLPNSCFSVSYKIAKDSLAARFAGKRAKECLLYADVLSQVY